MEKLDVSYTEESYPYLFFDGRRWTGFLVEIWRLLARAEGAELRLNHFDYPTGTEANGVFDGSLGAILNGSVVSSIDCYLLSTRPYRLSSFRTSSVAFYTKAQFVEGSRATAVESSRLTFFTVFSLDTIVVLILSHIVFVSLGVAITQLRRRRLQRPPSSGGLFGITCLLFEATQAVHVLSLALVVYYHAAGFQGNNAIFVPAVTDTFAKAVKDMREGGRRLVVTTADSFFPSEFLTGRSDPGSDRLVVAGSLQSFIDKICDPSSNVMGQLYEGDETSFVRLQKPCKYNKIAYSSVGGEDATSLRFISQMSPFFYLFDRRKKNQRLINRLNQIVLRMFGRDQIEQIWTLRYMDNIKNYKYTQEEKTSISYSAISVERLETVLLFLLPCSVAAICTFFIELFAFSHHKQFIFKYSVSLHKE